MKTKLKAGEIMFHFGISHVHSLSTSRPSPSSIYGHIAPERLTVFETKTIANLAML